MFFSDICSLTFCKCLSLTCRMIRDAAASMQKLVQSGKSPVEAWNGSTVMLTWAAIVSHYFDYRSVLKNTIMKYLHYLSLR